jgi:N-acyl-D-aspartate/D-glutamate deacylase
VAELVIRNGLVVDGTFVAGIETYADGEWTGATPGRLVRGAS